MPAFAVRAITALLALYALCWSKPRLDCLSYSAFEYAQAALIRSALAAPLRALGLHHWMYSRFYSPWRAALLGLYYISPVYLILQFFLPVPLLWFVAGAYSLISIAVIAACTAGCVTGRDQRRHLPYNSFAPLLERQRHKLNQQRNQVRLSPLLQKMDLFRDTGEVIADAAEREKIYRQYQRY